MQIVSFRGRIGRAGFFWSVVLLYGLATVFAFVGTIGGVSVALDMPAKDISAALQDFKLSEPVGWLSLIVGLLGFFGSLLGIVGASVRRLHDFGLTGFFVLLYPVLKYVIPDFGWALEGPADLLCLVILVAQPATRGPNAFGPDPRATPVETAEAG